MQTWNTLPRQVIERWAKAQVVVLSEAKDLTQAD